MLRYALFMLTMTACAVATAAGDAQRQELDLASLEIIAEFDLETPPGNVAVSPDGRIFMSLHAFYSPRYRVVEVLSDGSTRPYPSESWALPPAEADIGLNNVLGLQADRDGLLWMLDNNPSEGQMAKIVAWDTQNDVLHRVIYLGQPVIPDNAFLNDLAVDRDNNVLYIADTTGIVDDRPNDALIIVHLDTGLVRRVLEGHPSVVSEAISVAPDGIPITVDGKPVRVGVNSITIDPSNEWLYYGPFTGTSLYRVRTADLRDTALSSETLAERVERFGKKPVSDGITIDNAGNVYITDINANGIGVVRPDGTYQRLMTDAKRLSWPDGFATGPEGKIYVVVNQLHRSPFLGAEQRSPKPPFFLIRFTPLAPVTIGR